MLIEATMTHWLLPPHQASTVLIGHFIAGVLFVSTAAQAQDAQVRAAFERGAQAMRSGQTAAAEAAFRDAVRLAPGMAEAYVDLGLVLGREGKMDEAIATLNKALTLDPAAPSVHLYLGIFLYNSNQPDRAREQLQAELTQHPDNAEALTWLGTIDLALGHPERAIVSLDQANKLTPDDLNVLELRGQAHNLVAKDSYARMATLAPGNWHVHRVQAQLYADEGKHTDAIAELQAAIKLQPNNPDLYEGLGDEYRSLSQLDAAEAAYRKGLELGPANPVALYNLGSTKVENGDNAGGVALLRKMIEVYPNSVVAEYYLGRGLAAMGQDEQAVAWLGKSAQGANREIAKRSFYELARSYRKLHRADDAQQALASYDRLRALDEKQASQRVQDWRKLGESGPITP